MDQMDQNQCNSYEFFISRVDDFLSSVRGQALEVEERLFLEAAFKKVGIQQVIDQEKKRSGIEYEYRRVAGQPALINFLKKALGEPRVTKHNICDLLSQHNLDKIQAQTTNQPFFSGRGQEAQAVTALIKSNRLIVLHGEAGIGKTEFMQQLLKKLPQPFDSSVTLSLYTNPTVKTCLQLLQMKLGQEPGADIFATVKANPYLIVLESADALFRNTSSRTLLATEHTQEWCNFFWEWAERPHQSCLILVAQTPFADLKELEGSAPCAHYELGGLDQQSCGSILAEHELSHPELWNELARLHRYNPLALHQVGEIISTLYDGDVKKWMLLRSIHIPDQHFVYLQKKIQQISPLALEILNYLCEIDYEKKITFSVLYSQLRGKTESHTAIDNAIYALKEQGLAEIEQQTVHASLNCRKLVKQCKNSAFLQITPPSA